MPNTPGITVHIDIFSWHKQVSLSCYMYTYPYEISNSLSFENTHVGSIYPCHIFPVTFTVIFCNNFGLMFVCFMVSNKHFQCRGFWFHYVAFNSYFGWQLTVLYVWLVLLYTCHLSIFEHILSKNTFSCILFFIFIFSHNIIIYLFITWTLFSPC